MRSEDKKRNETSIPTQTCSGAIFQAQTIVPAASVSDHDLSAKKIFIFQIPFNCAIEELPHNFQLDVINL